MDAESGGEHPSQAGAKPDTGLYRFVKGLLRLRSQTAAGKFGLLLLGAYVLVAAQVFLAARGDLMVTRAILEVSSITELLVTIPAIVMLPVLLYVAATQIACYVLSKINARIGRYGVGIYALFVLLSAAPFVLMAAMPLAIAGLTLLVMIGVIVAPLLRFNRTRVEWKATVANSCRRYTDLWSADSAESVVSRDDPPHYRFIIGILIGGFVLVGLSAFAPRHWVPARILVLDASVSELGIGQTCRDQPDHTAVEVYGFEVGRRDDNATVLSLDRQCVMSVPTDHIESSAICTTERSWFVRTPWEHFTAADRSLSSCEA